MIFSRFRCAAVCASFLLIAGRASAAQIVSCRGQFGTVEFIDAKGRTLKFFKNKEEHKRKGDLITSNLVRVHGCLKGKFAYVVRHTSTCSYGEPCNEDEMHATLEIYDHTGKEIWRGDISIGNPDDVLVARSDERALYSSLTPPFGIVVIDPKGIKKHVPIKGGLYPNAISPNGRYVVVRGGLNEFVFVDVVSGKTHIYKGPGGPWVNDDGKFEVWVGSSLKNDWSLGPDGKRVYEFKFE